MGRSQGQVDADHVMTVSGSVGWALPPVSRDGVRFQVALHLLLLYLCAMPLLKMPFVEGLEERTFEHSTLMHYARDAKSTLQPNETQRNTLIVAAVYILIIGILWYVMSSVLLRIYSRAT